LDPAAIFGPRLTVEQVEEGHTLAPKFDANGLIPAVTTDYDSGELLMHGYMNATALELTIKTGEAHYFSRSRQAIWHKGATSGLVQTVRELRIDDDQDCVWLRVDVQGGASCHVGYRSCFYRTVPTGPDIATAEPLELSFTEHEKVFDPEVVYPGVENPTKL
jgi:phosphoribosyl-AMP cyclohydrolase